MAPPQRRFFTTAEYQQVDDLTEQIIPADEHSGGARAAGVAAFLDASLAESDPAVQRQWRAGLRALRGVRLADAVKTEFFGELKRRTAHAYYTSKIGIHDEMGYKGNTIQQGD